jgi:hypothetical protein
LTDQALAEALAWAGAAAEVLLALQARVWPPTELHPQLTGVTADRVEIHQATGAIAADRGQPRRRVAAVAGPRLRHGPVDARGVS